MVENAGFSKRFQALSRNKKIGLLSAGAVILYTAFGFLAAPFILKGVLEKKLPQILNRQVSIEKIRLNPYSLAATVEGFSLAKKTGAGHLFYFDRLYINLESLSLVKKALIIKSITLTGPSVDFDFLGDKTYSFSDLIVEKNPKKDAKADQSPFLFSINNIEIKDGTIKFNDRPKKKRHEVVNLNLAAPSISNLPSHVKIYVQPAFSAEINGTPTSLGGVTKPFDDSLATEINITMQGIDIPHYLAYAPNPTDLTIKSATMDIDAKLTYVANPDKTSKLGLIGKITLRGLTIADQEGQSYLNLPSLTVVSGDSNLLKKEIRLAEIIVDTPRLELFRLANGDILPLAMLAPGAQNTPETPPEKQEDKKTDQDTVKLTIDKFSLGKGEVFFSDRALQNPTKIEVSEISLQASNLATIAETVGEISYAMLLNGTGRLSGKGNLTIEPLALQSSLNINSLRLKDFQSYVSEQAQILLVDGTAELQGDLKITKDLAGATGLYFSGQSSVANLATADTLIGDDLLKWKDLQVRNITFSSRPTELSIGEINLQDMYARVLVNEDGTVNLATLKGNELQNQASAVPDEKDLATDAAGTDSGSKITISTISLSNGQIQFLDKKIKPAYETSLSSLNGVITGLSSQTESRASLKFEGKVDQQAPLVISGDINPLSQENFADIKIDFSDFNLSSLSPYTGKYVGLKTSKGKLNLDLSYEIRGQKLNSTNKAFLDQFTLGERVESPDATSLPVNLAISLLKNRQGEISLDIPVSGDFDDPEFSVVGIVFEVIVNLIAKAATSPFALLGSLIPEGKDLQHIVFETGSDDLTEDAVDNLGLVAKVLYERPGLKMDIAGFVDRELDSQVLARMKLAKQIKFEKLTKSETRENRNIDYKSISVGADEYPRYLELAYKRALKEASDEERKVAKKVESTSAAEAHANMENFILAGIKIADEDLRLLAIARANRVLSYLIKEGGVEPERLFMVEPQMGVMAKDDQELNKTMVELLIK